MIGTMHWFDIVVLVVYFASMAALGPIFERKGRTTEGYFLGDRSFPGWLLGFSMFAASISSITFMAYPADAYKTSWLRMLPNFMFPLGVLIAVRIYLPFFRRTKITSAYEYLEGRFGPNVRLYAACCYIIMQVVRTSVILYLVSELVQVLTGLNPILCVFIGGTVTSFYTITGGIRAVLWTDFIQAIVLWVGGLVCVVVIAIHLGGPISGLGEIVRVGVRDAKFQFSELTSNGTESIVIAESTEDDGEIEWTLPADIAEGDDYMVRVTSPAVQDGSTIPVTVTEDVSNVNLHISSAEPPAELALITPNLGEKWVAGTTETIRWRPGDTGAGPVKIELLSNEAPVQTLAETVPNTGAFDWAIPAGFEAGSKYQVAVTSLTDPATRTVSSVFFSVSDKPAAALTVLSPNGGEYWKPGSTQTINWIPMGNTNGPVKVELVKGRKLHPVPWGFSPDCLTKKVIILMLLIGLGDWLTEFCSNQNVVQRYAAARSAKDARHALWINCWFSVPTWALFMFLGTGLYAFYQTYSTPKATAMLEGIEKAEGILPYFVLHQLPPGISGLVIAAVLAAAMSSLSASINSVSAVSIVDVYRRRLVKGRDDKHYVFVAKCIGGVLAVLMVGGALILVVTKSNTLQDTWRILTALCAGGLMGLYLLGFLTRTGDGRSVGMGILFTLIFTFWIALSDMGWIPQGLNSPFDSYYAGLIGHGIMFALGYGLGKLLPKRERDLHNLTVYDQDDVPLD